jgi:hypothetical protein
MFVCRCMMMLVWDDEELAVASQEEKDCVYYCVMIITIIELRYVWE